MEQNRRTVLKALASSAMLGVGCAPSTSESPSASSDSGADTGPTGGTDSAVDTGDLPPLPDGYEEGEWVAEGAEDLDVFPHGLQVGDVTVASAILSVRAAAPEVLVEVVGVDESGWWPVHRDTHFLDDRAAQVEVTGLRPDTDYAWVARTTPDTRSVVGRFRTPPLADTPRVVRFGAVSCLGGNEPWPCLSRAAEEGLDTFLFLGDTIYADWGFFGGVQDKWDDALAQQGMRDLTASTSIIATWDDHEVDNNFNPDNTSAVEIDAGRDAFREALPQRQGAEGQIWRKVSWGPVDFFVLDCRGERTGGDYVSRAQLDWLKAALSESTARFKVILNSVPITDLSFIPVVGDIAAEDRWQGFPAQREELVAHCADIPGVFFVSGDFHVGAAALIDPADSPGGHLLEVLAGPGGSPVDSAYSLIAEGDRIVRVVPDHNVTVFTCDPATGELTVEWIGNDGEVLNSLETNL